MLVVNGLTPMSMCKVHPGLSGRGDPIVLSNHAEMDESSDHTNIYFVFSKSKHCSKWLL